MTTPAAVRFAAPLLVLASLGAATVRADDAAKEPQKVELKLSVKTGDDFYFRQKQTIQQAMKIGEMDVDSTISMDQTMTYSVAAVRENGEADVKVTIGDIKGSFENSLLGTFEFDSASGEEPGADNPMLGPVLKGLTMQAHKSFQLTFDSHGGIVKVTGMKEIIEEALKSNPAFAGKSMGGLLDDEGMKQQMQGQFAHFADGPVAIGAKWTVESSVKAPIEMKIVTEYTLASADAAKAVVTSTSSTPTDGAAGKPVTDSQGNVTISRTDGLMLRSETKTHTVMDMAMGAGKAPGGGQGQKMHMDMTVNQTIERVTAADVKPAPKKDPAPAAKPTPPAPAPK